MKKSVIDIVILIKVFLLPILALASADQPYCEPCLEGFGKLGQFLIQEESLERQVDVLSAFICTEDTEGCFEGIKKWWPAMARAIFANEGTIPAICGDIEVCQPMRNYLPRKVEITCDICQVGIEKIALVLQSEHNILRVIDLLTGDAFCTEPSSGLGQECIDFVVDFTPKAMPVMSELFLDQMPIFCGDVLGYC